MVEYEELLAADLIGERLLQATTSWHHHAEHTPALVHLWLHLEQLGPVKVHTPGTGVSMRIERVHKPYSMEQFGEVKVVDNAPNTALTQFVGQSIRSVREITYRDTRLEFIAGLTRHFPDGIVRLLALDDELVIAHDLDLGDIAANLHEDVLLARVVQTCGSCPSQWNAWTTGGQYLFLRYRHGEGSVEQHPSAEVSTWDGEGSRLWTRWEDGRTAVTSGSPTSWTSRAYDWRPMLRSRSTSQRLRSLHRPPPAKPCRSPAKTSCSTATPGGN